MSNTARSHHKAQPITRKHPAGGPNGALDLSILTDEISGLVREPDGSVLLGVLCGTQFLPQVDGAPLFHLTGIEIYCDLRPTAVLVKTNRQDMQFLAFTQDNIRKIHAIRHHILKLPTGRIGQIPIVVNRFLDRLGSCVNIRFPA